jgi:hypothetical protein
VAWTCKSELAQSERQICLSVPNFHTAKPQALFIGHYGSSHSSPASLFKHICNLKPMFSVSQRDDCACTLNFLKPCSFAVEIINRLACDPAFPDSFRIAFNFMPLVRIGAAGGCLLPGYALQNSRHTFYLIHPLLLINTIPRMINTLIRSSEFVTTLNMLNTTCYKHLVVVRIQNPE